MNVDNFLRIGNSHTVCQDYILTGMEPFPYIILADGCSSSANSDIGARLLCHSALSFITENIHKIESLDWNDVGSRIITPAWTVLKDYFQTLSLECLDATLIIAFKYENNYHVFAYGDGCIYFIKKDGTVCFDRIWFEPNTPIYLRYKLGLKCHIQNEIVMNVEQKREEIVRQSFAAMTPFYQKIPADDIKTFVVASDGIESIAFKDNLIYKRQYQELCSALKRRTFDPSKYDFSISPPAEKELQFSDVLKVMTEFKLTKGQFLHRRATKVLKEYLYDGFVNIDDLSIGCFIEDEL